MSDVCYSRESLGNICQQLQSILGGVSVRAAQSYQKHPRGHSPSDAFVQAQCYTTVSNAFTFAMVTQSSQSQFEIADLPDILQASGCRIISLSWRNLIVQLPEK